MLIFSVKNLLIFNSSDLFFICFTNSNIGFKSLLTLYKNDLNKLLIFSFKFVIIPKLSFFIFSLEGERNSFIRVKNLSLKSEIKLLISEDILLIKSTILSKFIFSFKFLIKSIFPSTFSINLVDISFISVFIVFSILLILSPIVSFNFFISVKIIFEFFSIASFPFERILVISLKNFSI